MMVSFIFCQVPVVVHIMPAWFVLLHCYNISPPLSEQQNSAAAGVFIEGDAVVYLLSCDWKRWKVNYSFSIQYLVKKYLKG